MAPPMSNIHRMRYGMGHDLHINNVLDGTFEQIPSLEQHI